MRFALGSFRVRLLSLLAAIVVAPANAIDQQVFYDDFDGGQEIPAPVQGGFSGYINIESVQRFNGIGNGTNIASGNFLHNPTGDQFTNTPSEKTTIILSGLPPHASIRLEFLLAIIDTWDGQNASGSIADFFNVSVDGVTVFRESFRNFANFSSAFQSYVPPPGGLVAGPIDLFRGDIFADSLYDMGIDTVRFGNIPHSASTLSLDFVANGPNWNRPANESWAFDNIRVTLHIPEPTCLASITVAVELLKRRRRC